ncbi:TPA: hypothetical protein U2C07_001349 [Streptococcus suis]|nr:hypothetical protein [Streptococcus suis]HEP1786657.1 hypothetical protein [Streptococcus suis]HEP1802964.1 hypothetical protein [Streptococcus suis]
MEPYITESVVNAGIELGILAVKGTTAKINSKIQSMKTEREADKLRSAYDDIVNELIIERAEALRIAQIYKEEYEKVTIKDEDIEYLHNTLIRIISLFNSFGNVTEEQTVSFQQMAELLNKDTLKTMQLLGFNYREAIGEPLTEVCANTIKSKLGNFSKAKKKK